MATCRPGTLAVGMLGKCLMRIVTDHDYCAQEVTALLLGMALHCSSRTTVCLSVKYPSFMDNPTGDVLQFHTLNMDARMRDEGQAPLPRSVVVLPVNEDRVRRQYDDYLVQTQRAAEQASRTGEPSAASVVQIPLSFFEYAQRHLNKKGSTDARDHDGGGHRHHRLPVVRVKQVYSIMEFTSTHTVLMSEEGADDRVDEYNVAADHERCVSGISQRYCFQQVWLHVPWNRIRDLLQDEQRRRAVLLPGVNPTSVNRELLATEIDWRTTLRILDPARFADVEERFHVAAQRWLAHRSHHARGTHGSGETTVGGSESASDVRRGTGSHGDESYDNSVTEEDDYNETAGWSEDERKRAELFAEWIGLVRARELKAQSVLLPTPAELELLGVTAAEAEQPEHRLGTASGDTDAIQWSVAWLLQDASIDVSPELQAAVTALQQALTTTGMRNSGGDAAALPSQQQAGQRFATRARAASEAVSSGVAMEEPAVALDDLTSEQLLAVVAAVRMAFDVSHRGLRADDTTPLQLIVTGGAGTGKSCVVERIAYEVRRLRGASESVRIMSFLGSAAALVNGRTIHSGLGLSVTNPMGAPSYQKSVELQRTWEHTDVLIVDEYSTVSGLLYTAMEKRIAQHIRMQDHVDECFGSVVICLCGDLGQLDPIRTGYPLHVDPSTSGPKRPRTPTSSDDSTDDDDSSTDEGGASDDDMASSASTTTHRQRGPATSTSMRSSAAAAARAAGNVHSHHGQHTRTSTPAGTVPPRSFGDKANQRLVDGVHGHGLYMRGSDVVTLDDTHDPNVSRGESPDSLLPRAVIVLSQNMRQQVLHNSGQAGDGVDIEQLAFQRMLAMIRVGALQPSDRVGSRLLRPSAQQGHGHGDGVIPEEVCEYVDTQSLRELWETFVNTHSMQNDDASPFGVNVNGEEWRRAVWIFLTNRPRNLFNELAVRVDCLATGNAPVRITAADKPPGLLSNTLPTVDKVLKQHGANAALPGGGANATARARNYSTTTASTFVTETVTLLNRVSLFPNARVMVTINGPGIWSEWGIVNGATGTVKRVHFNPTDLPMLRKTRVPADDDTYRENEGTSGTAAASGSSQYGTHHAPQAPAAGHQAPATVPENQVDDNVQKAMAPCDESPEYVRELVLPPGTMPTYVLVEFDRVSNSALLPHSLHHHAHACLTSINARRSLRPADWQFSETARCRSCRSTRHTKSTAEIRAWNTCKSLAHSCRCNSRTPLPLTRRVHHVFMQT